MIAAGCNETQTQGAATAGSSKPQCANPPCVSVTPKRAPAGAVFMFRGTGWRPRVRVEALYGPYCPPRRACRNLGLYVRFRADSDGRFVFRFREGPGSAAGLKPPAAAGSGRVIFEQFAGRPYRSRVIRRRPCYAVER